tara:strand:- start:1644 stop:1787 length:144 start_codon:yes stop_codon:yes gene_type:complete
LLIFGGRISLVAFAVYTGGPFGDEMDAVSVEEASNPALGDWLAGYFG